MAWMNPDENHISNLHVTITEDTIKSVLHAMKHDQDLPDNELAKLRIINNAIPDILPKAIHDHLLIEWLADRITTKLNTVRQPHNLLQAQKQDDSDTVLNRTITDFSIDDKHLHAWSILYLTFIRVDVGLTDRALSKIILVSTRTIRRRRSYGYQLLLIDILIEEINPKSFPMM